MTINYRKKLRLEKTLLNFLLKYLSTNNRLVIYISQDLDKLINKYQKNIYTKYVRKNIRSNAFKKVA